LISVLIAEIVSPYKQESQVKIGKHVLDGRVKIGRGRSILYEIFVGNLSAFRYDSLLDLVDSMYLPRRTYFLVIARSFSEKDKERIHNLTRMIEMKKVKKMCFLDYEVLISLHRYCSDIDFSSLREDLKTLKRLFLENLFEYSPIVHEESFERVLIYARQQYDLIMAPALKAPGLEIPAKLEERYEIDERKLRDLEELLEKALHEIRALRRKYVKED